MTVAVKMCVHKSAPCRGVNHERFSIEAGFLDGQALVVGRGVQAPMSAIVQQTRNRSEVLGDGCKSRHAVSHSMLD
jgi:hypothetical protein